MNSGALVLGILICALLLAARARTPRLAGPEGQFMRRVGKSIEPLASNRGRINRESVHGLCPRHSGLFDGRTT